MPAIIDITTFEDSESHFSVVTSPFTGEQSTQRWHTMIEAFEALRTPTNYAADAAFNWVEALNDSAIEWDRLPGVKPGPSISDMEITELTYELYRGTDFEKRLA